MINVNTHTSRHHLNLIPITAVLIITSPVLAIATQQTTCPQVCQCTQSYYVYCEASRLTSDSLHRLMRFVPSEVLLLNVDFNDVDALSSTVFESVRNLEYLSLADNNVHTLELGVFQSLQRLKELSLRNNHLTEIRSDVFVNISSLQKLHLDGNNISHIQERALVLSNLRELYLQGNRLTVLTPFLLQGLSNLIVLDLSDNQLQVLDKAAFGGLRNLQKLLLSRNLLSSLVDGVFEGLISLRELYLDGNMLSSVDCLKAPSLAHSLQQLVLTNNSLTSVPSSVFSNLHSLRIIELGHNNLSRVDKQAFKDLQLDKLILTHNGLEIIDRDMFDEAQGISLLDLSYNFIHTFKTGAMDMFRESLHELNLAGNRLRTLHRGMFRGMNNLQHLNLSSNKIFSIMNETFKELIKLVSLDLSHNNLQRLSAHTLQGPSLHHLSVLNNPLQEMRGLGFEEADHPVNAWVNLTLKTSSANSLTVVWPYRQGKQLYWALKLWCVSSEQVDCACCSPLLEVNIAPNKASYTIEELQGGEEYFVCVDPVFLDTDVQVFQCGKVFIHRHPHGPVELMTQRDGIPSAGVTVRGPSSVICFSIVMVLLMMNVV